MSHQTPKRSEGRYGRRGRMPVCRRCRKADATVNAFCDACWDADRAQIIEQSTDEQLTGLWDDE